MNDQNDELTPEEWHALSDRQMAALLTNAWDRSLVSLTDAVYWISTNGELREPDDDDLDAAANLLISDLQAGELAALGIPAGEEMHRHIPVEDILSATANGVRFFNDLNLFTVPALLWAYLPGEDRDLILGVTGNLWSHIAVKREEMKSRWPGRDTIASVQTGSNSNASAKRRITKAKAEEMILTESSHNGGRRVSQKAAAKFLVDAGVIVDRATVVEIVKKHWGDKRGRPEKSTD
ncbi:MAG: hypothetical protein K5821_10490 [Nitrobacter sp.]|uniref:hypothetical protein n=1 Tax=Nitrobacter sp. TaxID=29420 RepID=UPI002606FA84|nr:hypothetical protein [Nitrobacter sp.]MCV0386851.1 hypothetical protein [Nitrobacter sp.]